MRIMGEAYYCAWAPGVYLKQDVHFTSCLANIPMLCSCVIMASTCECPLCNFSAPSRSLWLSHIRNVHYNDTSFNLTCGINECTSTYTRCASFVSHVYRQHRDIVVNQASTSACTNSDQGQLEPVYEYMTLSSMSTSEDRTSLQHAIDQILETDQEEQKKKGALFRDPLSL